jgi:hypothetical protein
MYEFGPGDYISACCDTCTPVVEVRIGPAADAAAEPRHGDVIEYSPDGRPLVAVYVPSAPDALRDWDIAIATNALLDAANDAEVHALVDLSAAVECATRMLAALASPVVAEPREAGWRPIETAPKDGTRILGWCYDEVETLYWCESVWVTAGGAWVSEEARSDTMEYLPTHWLPLPAPPRTPSQDSEEGA